VQMTRIDKNTSTIIRLDVRESCGTLSHQKKDTI
jgi:hypothetical protein